MALHQRAHETMVMLIVSLVHETMVKMWMCDKVHETIAMTKVSWDSVTGPVCCQVIQLSEF